jgi:hypothetical protein
MAARPRRSPKEVRLGKLDDLIAAAVHGRF